MIQIAATIIMLASVPQAFEYHNSSPETLFPFQKAVAETTYPAGINNPALLPFSNSAYLSLAGGRPYGLSDLYATTISTGYGFDGFGIQAHWSRFGIKEYCENRVEANTGFKLFDVFSIGVGLNYYHLAISGGVVDFSTQLIDGKFAILFSPIENLRIAYMQDNIYSLWHKERRDLLDPRRSLGIGINPVKGLSCAWNLYSDYQGYINSIEITVQILKSFSLQGGYAKEVATYSVGCVLSYKHITFSYGFRFQPLLGNTHAAGISVTLDYLKTNSISYQSAISPKQFIRPQKKININACTSEELLTIPGMNASMAQRIINYRKIFGEISLTSLYQLGFNRSGIQNMLPFINGLAAESKSKHSEKFKPFPQKNRQSQFIRAQQLQQRKKQLFLQLLQLDLSASQASDLTDLAIERNTKKLQETIQRLQISSENKTRVSKLCGI